MHVSGAEYYPELKVRVIKPIIIIMRMCFVFILLYNFFCFALNCPKNHRTVIFQRGSANSKPYFPLDRFGNYSTVVSNSKDIQ